MRVCVVAVTFDAFKGGNHLPLFAALPDVTFTILTNTTTPKDPVLPSNVSIVTLHQRIGPYYYGCADYLFARAVLRCYPPKHAFWKEFDVIHINQTMGPALLQLRETGVPLCFFIHHPVSADREVALQESSGRRRWIWKAKYALLLRWQRRLCHTMPHTATVSHTAAQRIADDYGVPLSSVSIIPNGVDAGRFIPGACPTVDFDVIAIGSFIHPRKGFPYLLRVYRKLARYGYKIADVGRRSGEQRCLLADVPGVRVFGMVGEERLLSLLRCSAVLISTSLYEGFGLSLIEALACGRPAFAFDAGAVREVLGPVDAGLIVPLRDTTEFTHRVIRFLERTPAERVCMGAAYREAVEHLYSLERSARALLALYARLKLQGRMGI